MFPKIRGTPKKMVKIMENPIRMDDLGVPLYRPLIMPYFFKGWGFHGPGGGNGYCRLNVAINLGSTSTLKKQGFERAEKDSWFEKTERFAFSPAVRKVAMEISKK